MNRDDNPEIGPVQQDDVPAKPAAKPAGTCSQSHLTTKIAGPR